MALIYHLGVFLFFLVVQLQQPFMVEPRSLKPTSEQSLHFHEGIAEDVTGVREYLKAFGYLDNNLPEEDMHDEGLESAIKKFQQYYHLNVSGKPDFETIKLMSTPRCGTPDHSIHYDNKYYFFQGLMRWPDDKTHLTYSFQSGIEVESLETMRYVFGVALAQWSNATRFSFEEVVNGTQPDILIGFFRGDHGDGTPFDGPGNMLAHAFPPNDGRLHFDADEQWTTAVPPQLPSQYDLIWVAIHELGHVLGLQHTPDQNAIMFPFMKPGVNKRALGSDDIAGIKALYDLPNLHYSASVALQWDYLLMIFTLSSSLFISLFTYSMF